MPEFPRGFKTYCERLVDQLRDELSVCESDPIDMHVLAQHLEIPLRPLGDYVEAAGIPANDPHIAEAYLKVSAVTYFEGRRRLVVYNETHSPRRHRSNLAHEFAHALLHHPPEDEDQSDAGHRLREAEAAWLGGVLMLTNGQALSIARSSVAVEEATARFQLSRDMLVFRLRATGALKRFPRYWATAASAG